MHGPPFALPPLPAHVRDIVVFVAMESEARPIAEALGLHAAVDTDAPRDQRDGSERVGLVGATPVRLVTPGSDPETGVDCIGPVHAAASLAHALARKPTSLVVNFGTAGGFESRGQRIADLVLARDAMFHDARVALAGFDRLSRGHTRMSPDDTMLARLAAQLDARVGLVSTGSSLDATTAELELFAREGTLAKEMELAALATVCRRSRTPLAALKGITDLVDHHEPTHEAFLRNLEATCRRIAAAARDFVVALARAE